MADISEVLLQTAQVVNQSYAMLAQARQADATLELKKQEYESLASAREERIKYQEDALEQKKQVDSLKLEMERMRIGIAQDNADTASTNSETGKQNADTNAYKAKVQAAAAASKLSGEDTVKLQKELDAKVVGVHTGDPELDKGLIYQTQSQIRNMYGKARSTVEAGAPLPPEMQQAARLMHIPDQDYAQREMARFEKLLKFRDDFAKEKLIPAYQEKEKNVLNSMSFLQDAKQTADTGAQNAQSAQMRQNMDPSAQAVLGAPPGVVGGGLTMETQAAMSEVANFTAETLGNPSGFNASAQKLANLIRERKLAGDNKGATAIGAAAAQKSPGLALRANELYKALAGQQK